MATVGEQITKRAQIVHGDPLARYRGEDDVIDLEDLEELDEIVEDEQEGAAMVQELRAEVGEQDRVADALETAKVAVEEEGEEVVMEDKPGMARPVVPLPLPTRNFRIFLGGFFVVFCGRPCASSLFHFSS